MQIPNYDPYDNGKHGALEEPKKSVAVFVVIQKSKFAVWRILQQPKVLLGEPCMFFVSFRF